MMAADHDLTETACILHVVLVAQQTKDDCCGVFDSIFACASDLA